MKLINYLSKQSNPDKIISIIIVAFLSAVLPLALGIFNMPVFIATLVLVAILFFAKQLSIVLKSASQTPEGNIAIGMIGLIILLVIMILNR